MAWPKGRPMGFEQRATISQKMLGNTNALGNTMTKEQRKKRSRAYYISTAHQAQLNSIRLKAHQAARKAKVSKPQRQAFEFFRKAGLQPIMEHPVGRYLSTQSRARS